MFDFGLFRVGSALPTSSGLTLDEGVVSVVPVPARPSRCRQSIDLVELYRLVASDWSGEVGNTYLGVDLEIRFSDVTFERLFSKSTLSPPSRTSQTCLMPPIDRSRRDLPIGGIRLVWEVREGV